MLQVFSAEQKSENELLSLVRMGNEEAFRSIYFLYSKRLYGNILKIVRSETIAQELLQDLFMKIWNNRESIDTERSFRSYLFKVAENLVYDFFRKASRDKSLEKMLIETTAASRSEEDQKYNEEVRVELLHEAINALSPNRKKVFELCKLEVKTYDEVSEILGISHSTISDHIVKANRFIKEYCLRNQSSMSGFLLILMLME